MLFKFRNRRFIGATITGITGLLLTSYTWISSGDHKPAKIAAVTPSAEGECADPKQVKLEQTENPNKLFFISCSGFLE